MPSISVQGLLFSSPDAGCETENRRYREMTIFVSQRGGGPRRARTTAMPLQPCHLTNFVTRRARNRWS
jgi:hypothetical protein